MNLRFLKLTVTYSVLFIICSCGSKQKQEAPAQGNKGAKGPVKVDGYIVQTKPVSEQIQIPGTIKAQDETQIHPEVAGRITNLYINEGAYVNKGALLAKLYDADLQAQKKKLEV